MIQNRCGSGAQLLRVTTLALILAAYSFAAEPEFSSLTFVHPVLEAFQSRLPAALANTTPETWDSWNRQNDQTIRGRLDAGDVDSMVNLLLFGTSFTRQPRIGIQDLAELTRRGVLKARVADLVRGLAQPGNNQRLEILRDLIRRNNIDPDSPEGQDRAGVFILENLQRVLLEKRTYAARSAAEVEAAKQAPSGATNPTLAERAELFRDRGVSLDTGLLPDFSIDLALRRLKERGVLRPGQVRHVAVIGPGLEFIDKNEAAAFDYFPLQTIQPFAVMDSLLRIGLADRASLSLTILDISPRVIEHLRNARQQAQKKNAGYVIQLPQDVGYSWPAAFEEYWRTFGGQIGTEVKPIAPPAVFAGLRTRAVQVHSDFVLRCDAVDLNMVAQHLNLDAEDRFDLVIATNVFLYYDAFQQALALQNTAAMLKSGGLLLSNDQLPVLPASGMQVLGVTEISDGGTGRDALATYQKR